MVDRPGTDRQLRPVFDGQKIPLQFALGWYTIGFQFNERFNAPRHWRGVSSSGVELQKPTYEDKIWEETEELFKLLDGIREDEALKPAFQLSIEEDELRSRIYDKLAICLRPIIVGKVPQHDAREVLNETIYEVFSTYATYRERYTVRDFSRVVARNKMSAYFRQQGRYIATEDEVLEKLVSDKDLHKELPGEHVEDSALNASLEDVFRRINVGAEQLSEKEFMVFVLKVANFCVEKKLPETRLAAMVGLKRTTFRDVYEKARDKVYQQWKGRGEEELR